MRSAIEIPFDASKYAFRTNFDGLTSTNDAIKAHVDKLAEQYKQSLTNHESNDKAARKAHSEEKEEGMTEAGFGEWVGKNVSFIFFIHSFIHSFGFVVQYSTVSIDYVYMCMCILMYSV